MSKNPRIVGKFKTFLQRRKYLLLFLFFLLSVFLVWNLEWKKDIADLHSSLRMEEEKESCDDSSRRKMVPIDIEVSSSGTTKQFSAFHAVNVSTLPQSALNFLKAQQNVDGTWGADQDAKDMLTPLVVLAFLTHGETPASSKYGYVVQKGLRILLKRLEDGGAEPKEPSRIITIWCLAEAYGITKIPILKTIVTQMIKEGGFNYSSPWTLWALYSCFNFGIREEKSTKEEISNCMKSLEKSPRNLLNYSAGIYAVLRLKGWDAALPLFKQLESLCPNEWCESKQPMQTMLSLNMIMLDDQREQKIMWSNKFWKTIIWSSGHKEEDLFWWSAKGLRINPISEFPKLSVDDMNLYITSMMLISFYPYRRWPLLFHKCKKSEVFEEAGDLDLKLE